MSGKPPKKRKGTAASLRRIAKRLGIPYQHVPPNPNNQGQ
jgi:hypothetical protein